MSVAVDKKHLLDMSVSALYSGNILLFPLSRTAEAL